VTSSDLICAGDVFLEYVLPAVDDGSTVIVDTAKAHAGGGALHVARHLCQLGKRPSLVAVFAKQRLAALRFDDCNLQRMIWSDSVDQLVVMTGPRGHQAVFLRASMPEGAKDRFISACRRATHVVLAGSRHPEIRHAFMSVGDLFDRNQITFCPSYAILEFVPHELSFLFTRCATVIVNRAEAQFACKSLGYSTEEDLQEHFGMDFFVTSEHEGATLYDATGRLEMGSVSGLLGDVLGAGDAFAAALVAGKVDGRSARECLPFATSFAGKIAREVSALG
jgi:sugar/nucleoside kinase (ribokinase family)